jgi:hypothetical protein
MSRHRPKVPPSPRSNRRPSTPVGNDDIFLQSWYMPKTVSLQMRKILPSIHLAKMRYYFDDHGCLRYARRNILYGSNGVCENCSVMVRSRFAKCLEKRLKHVGVIENLPGGWKIVCLAQGRSSLVRGFGNTTRMFATARASELACAKLPSCVIATRVILRSPLRNRLSSS